MYKIAVIGAGQLGARHLQGLLKLSIPCEIWVIDPFSASLESARIRASEIAASAEHVVHFHESLDDLPEALDYAVVATSSDVRFSILEKLTQAHRLRYLVLEKVLFQDLDHYAKAIELVERHDIATWVNCTRRTYPIYRKAREFFAVDTIRSFVISGGEWGLGCNAIHFVDLCAYLSGERLTSFDTRDLDAAVLESRRKGFVEFTGILRGTSSTTGFEATAWANSAAPLLIQIRSDRFSCVLDEGSGVALFGDHQQKTWTREEFSVPFLSDVSTAIASGIIEEGHSLLPSLAESVACHLPLMASFGAFASKQLGTPATFCPVT